MLWEGPRSEAGQPLYTHTYIHTYTHTYIHIYMYTHYIVLDYIILYYVTYSALGAQSLAHPSHVSHFGRLSAFICQALTWQPQLHDRGRQVQQVHCHDEATVLAGT